MEIVLGLFFFYPYRHLPPGGGQHSGSNAIHSSTLTDPLILILTRTYHTQLVITAQASDAL